ncbi:MAG: 16S rRNA (cytidine(1402)-2'-O)-methyltransferase [Desulfobacterales bacterium]|nr:MAG: 16S rRNA (cytidine(1402)-2'-O)-methyltransferase [Desulfobacterales bacterium]
MSGDTPGTLYVVATPIGHRDDITIRALKVLADVDLVAAEDTRKTRKFLTLHGISNRLISYHDHNETERTPQLIAKLKSGASMALVSNAGTPTVSDPGYRLIEAAVDNNLKIIPVPGPCAATTALSVAGLPTDSFIFMGFPAKKKTKRIQQLKDLASQPRTLIFYESPKRILTLLNEIIDVMGDRRGVLGREVTKLHEEILRGRLSDIADQLKDRGEVKGECTLLIAGSGGEKHPSWHLVRQQIRAAVIEGQRSLSAIAREIAAASGIGKNRIYTEALKISKELDSG